VPGVGSVVAGHLREFFDNERNRRVVERLRAETRLGEPEPAEREVASELDGLTFVFTGSVDGWTRGTPGPRAAPRRERRLLGVWEHRLPRGGESPGQTKRDDAAAEGVPELDAESFFDVLAERGVDAE